MRKISLGQEQDVHHDPWVERSSQPVRVLRIIAIGREGERVEADRQICSQDDLALFMLDVRSCGYRVQSIRRLS
ncbi:hypothetical protein LWC08_01125 [Desulfobaculum bizertense]|uniref:hypothetical protein n=1 Tax=Desulfobaculum bizertense TaxID=376490 RepID=UPI001F2185B9|nr:hypothetical protein [Desulfobaculum bizertense]UIJ38188.1 hypothetical protein LWC08_01125 [Desulfobaculum bizertense]